jgi:LIVCS family branched-chain amino acid:cation transporter
MKSFITIQELLSLSLAIFCMLFGAGNLIYPLALGQQAGAFTTFGIMGFFITALLLPLTGLVAMILFNGDYQTFFGRIGKIPGHIITACCMLIIGPVVVIPRCITLSHTMIAPFLPLAFLKTITCASSTFFCIVFLMFTFLAAYKKNKIVSVLGNIIAPILLAAISFIIIKGLFIADSVVPTTTTPFTIFTTGFMMGYQTLDLLGTLFFASIIISIIKKMAPGEDRLTILALYGLRAGVIGLSLLGCVYIGMSALGAFHTHEYMHANPGELFTLISYKILGPSVAALVSISVLLACTSTAIGLSAVVAEYCRVTLFRETITYVQSLVLLLLSCIPLSVFGLQYVLQIAGGPIVYVGYPILIATTFCNIAYKLWGFRYIKIPVMITGIFATISYVASVII